MLSPLLILTALIPVLLIIGTGMAVRARGWLADDADASLMRIVVNVLYPCLIFSAILDNEALRDASTLIAAPALGAGTILLGFGLAGMVAHFTRLGTRKLRRTFSLVTGVYNYGYFPIPLIAQLFPEHAAEMTGVLLVHNVGVELALWTVGIWLISEGEGRTNWRRLISPPVVAVGIAVPLNLLHADQWLPSFLPSAVDMLGSCAIPIGLILIGVTLADLIRGGNLRLDWKVAGLGIGVRALLLPAVMLGLAVGLPLPWPLPIIVAIQAGMPCGMIPIVLARHYAGDANAAALIVVATTFVGFATIPLWLAFGLPLVQ